MTALGLITIGQAPRDDVTPDIRAHLPDDVELIEAGALDTFDSATVIQDEIGPREGQAVFVTRLRDGTSVTIDRAAAHELLQERIKEIETHVSTIGILCTGWFPHLDANIPILEPSKLLRTWVDGIVDDDATVGIIMPKSKQFKQTREKWSENNLVMAAGSPYAATAEVTAAAADLGTDPDIVVLDCIGYNHDMKATVRETTSSGVLLARSVLAKTATELL